MLLNGFYNRSASFLFAGIIQLVKSEAKIYHITSVNVNTDEVFFGISLVSPHSLPLKINIQNHTHLSSLNLYKVQEKIVSKCFMKLFLRACQIMKV